MATIQVATFNAHWGRRPEDWSRYDLAAALVATGADLLAVEEAPMPDAGDGPLHAAAEQLGYELFCAPMLRAVESDTAPEVCAEHEGDTSYGLALLSRAPLLDVEVDRLGPPREDRWGPRPVVSATLELDGARLTLSHAHLSSAVPRGPMSHLRDLARICDRRGSDVALGDFNFWGPGVVALMPGWRRAVRGRTWPAHRPLHQIDHIMVRHGVQSVSSRVLATTGSDHLGVTAELSLPGTR